MILKLLFTLGVIGIAWLVLRNRSRRGQVAANEQLARISRPSIQQSNSTPRLAAYGLIVFMILASGLVLYLQWRDQYRIVNVQVINTQTGLSESYQARFGDVEERQFQALDGRIVKVADIERIEVGGLP